VLLKLDAKRCVVRLEGLPSHCEHGLDRVTISAEHDGWGASLELSSSSVGTEPVLFAQWIPQDPSLAGLRPWVTLGVVGVPERAVASPGETRAGGASPTHRSPSVPHMGAVMGLGLTVADFSPPAQRPRGRHQPLSELPGAHLGQNPVAFEHDLIGEPLDG